MSFQCPPAVAEIEIHITRPYAPEKLENWLISRGWVLTTSGHPTTKEPLVMKNTSEGNLYCTWAEATAYEFYKFMSMGAFDNEAS